jgi:hypothetical protein
LTEPEKCYEFTVSFPAESEEEAQAVADTVLLAVCGGKKWKHKRLIRRFGWLNVCPRWFVGAGPYEIDEDGEAKTEAGKNRIRRWPAPTNWYFTGTNSNLITSNWTTTWPTS